MKPTNNASSSQVELDSKAHTELFTRAMKRFTAGDYEDAKELFDQASQGPVLSVNETAHMYSRMCARRIQNNAPELTTAEDYYNYAVSLMNVRKIADAVPHLQKAVSLGDAGHIRYALGLALGLQGDMPGAISHLQKAISLDPSIRTVARSDGDFQPLMQDHIVRELILGDRS
jgi:tetratricopeptide (TPR) repeat protein